MNLNPRIRFCRNGVSRFVILFGPLAIKLPYFWKRWGYGWRMGLYGILANLQERDWSETGWLQLCPVVGFHFGGLLLFMARAEPLTEDDWRIIEPIIDEWEGEVRLPVERKRDSYGWFQGRLVAVDYG